MQGFVDDSGDKPKEKCGVFGVYCEDGRVAPAARLTYLGLFALQHRGQESAGIVVSDGNQVRLHKDMGLVQNVFSEELLASMPGKVAIGHVRYSTTGQSLLANAQPLMGRCSKGTIALAHNGNLVNTIELERELERTGAVFQSTLDTELVLHLVARLGGTLEEGVSKCMERMRGSYSMVLMGKDKLIGFRDPYGVRPLCLGKLPNGYVFSSETCALDTVGAEFVEEVPPGEVLVVDTGGLTRLEGVPRRKRALCVFEFIYFARPDSNIDGQNVHLARKAMGMALAREYPVKADLIMAAPDSGICAAIGLSQESGVPYDTGLTKNRYIGRTFIQPTQTMRELGVKLKINPIKDLIKGKRVVVVDDSIVRGTTSRSTVAVLREAGAKEVHVYVAAPPIAYPCYYGIDTSARRELVASSRKVEEVRAYIGADTLRYLSLDSLKGSVGHLKDDLCVACFTGDYPIELPSEGGALKNALERGPGQEARKAGRGDLCAGCDEFSERGQ